MLTGAHDGVGGPGSVAGSGEFAVRVAGAAVRHRFLVFQDGARFDTSRPEVSSLVNSGDGALAWRGC